MLLWVRFHTVHSAIQYISTALEGGKGPQRLVRVGSPLRTVILVISGTQLAQGSIDTPDAIRGLPVVCENCVGVLPCPSARAGFHDGNDKLIISFSSFRTPSRDQTCIHNPRQLPRESIQETRRPRFSVSNIHICLKDRSCC